MSVMIRPKLITAKEFEKFDPEWRYDLIRGELRPMPPMPGEEHGAITSDLTLELSLFVRDQGLGQCYAAEPRFIIEHDPDTAITPDWAFVARDRLPQRRRKGFVPYAPDAILEVRSPNDREKDVLEKIQRWLDAGVRLALELNPKTRLLTVYRPGNAPRPLGVHDTLDGEDVLPGFRLPLRPFLADDDTEE